MIHRPNPITLASGQRLTHAGHYVGANAQVYRGDRGMLVLVSEDATPHGALLHVSVSYADRNPTWAELVDVKEQFFGDIDVMMVLPKRADYVNIHHHTFHLWQTPVAWNVR